MRGAAGRLISLTISSSLIVSSSLIIALALLLTFFPGSIGEAGKDRPGAAAYTSFRDIPGVTEDEIKAVEELIARGGPLIYGALPSAEAFYDESGRIRGFSALICNWMAELFGMPLELKLYEWSALLAGLESGEIDLTGELMATEKSRETYFMAECIAARLVGYFRISGGLPLAVIADTRPLRYGFLSGATTIDKVSAGHDYKFESFFAGGYEEAYTMLKKGEIDAFIDERTAEAAFDVYSEVYMEDFYPLIYGTVSLTTQNPANKPIIAIMQKAIDNDGMRYLTEMYNLGMREYQKHKLLSRLTEEERNYIQSRPVVRFVAEHDNYPVSFYNGHDKEFQGVGHDAIDEIAALTGLRFELVNDEQADWAEILEMLETGEASMISELIRTPEREGRFLWPETAITTDRHALLSKAERRDINVNDALYMKVGLVESYAHTEVFNSWFPEHKNTMVYDSFVQAVAALERGELDLVMGSQNKLLIQTSFHGQPGYKANLVFDYTYKSTFGFNKDEAVLCSIVDKALRLINISGIEGRWTSRTYDYRMQLAQQRLLWQAGAIVLIMCIILLLYLSKAKKRLEAESRFKSQFLATISHEIRSPMNAIMGIAQIELHKENLPDERSAALKRIYCSGSNLLGIINDILDMSKIESGRLELNLAEYDMPGLISDTLQLNIVCIGSKPIELLLKIDENLPSRFYGDEVRIKQILNNLLSNAVKYTEEGCVGLSVSHFENKGAVFLRFVVDDTGQGLKSGDLKKLFSEYSRFNAEANYANMGTGLGLSITKRLVGMMGGTIEVESEYGRGSVFTVTIRQKAVECPAIGPELAQRLRDFGCIGERQIANLKIAREPMPYGSVLVVDDLDTNLYVAKGLLAPYMLKIEMANSGYAALEKVNSGKTYDVIFMDHMMPQMDGLETTRRLRERGYAGIIVALTANALVGNDEMFAQNGFDGFISKPIDARMLNQALNRFVRDRNPEEAKKYKPETVAQAETLAIDPKVLQAFRSDAEKAIITLKEKAAAGEMNSFTVAAHGMKSALANVGEREVSEVAAKLESAGLDGDADYISANLMGFINTLETLMDKFSPAENSGAGREDAVKDEAYLVEDEAYLIKQMNIIKAACEGYDDDTAYLALDRLKEHPWKPETAGELEQIRDALFIYSDFEGAAERSAALINDRRKE